LRANSFVKVDLQNCAQAVLRKKIRKIVRRQFYEKRSAQLRAGSFVKEDPHSDVQTVL